MISYCFVDPDQRNRGVASLMMQWGTKKADELGLDIFVESTEHGCGFYEACGFKVLEDFNLTATKENPSPEFTRLVKELQLPCHGYYMKRPKGGRSLVYNAYQDLKVFVLEPIPVLNVSIYQLTSLRMSNNTASFC